MLWVRVLSAHAIQVKLSSETDASATPATMGSRLIAVMGETVWPRRSQERPHVKTGSEALTIWVKETAPALAETTACSCGIVGRSGGI